MIYLKGFATLSLEKWITRLNMRYAQNFALVLDLLKTLSWHSGEAISGLMFVLNTPKQTGV